MQSLCLFGSFYCTKHADVFGTQKSARKRQNLLVRPNVLATPATHLLPDPAAGTYNPALRDSYHISNFGDSVMCYSDVAPHETYLLFLTEFEGALSARYDDIFGAAAAFNDKNELEVLASLGESRFHVLQNHPCYLSLLFSLVGR